jgi:hypothetical protein
MSRRNITWLGVFGVVATVAFIAPVVIAAQDADGKAKAAPSAAKSTSVVRKSAPRTPWGDPDLQGVWDYRTITPMERPQNMAGRSLLTDEEAARLEAQAAKQLDAPPDENTPANLVHAPYMTDRGRKVLDDKRTSLIIDPADGRVPPLTPEGQARLAARRGGRDGGADGPENRSTAERCITYGFPNANLPTLYNNNIQIVQGPGYVAVTHEMIHETRLIPLDGRPPLDPKIKQWFGDYRGHWEGDTLVVESRNFSDKTNFRGAGATLHTIERFTRLGKDALDYRLTIDDSHTFVRPWTIDLPMRPSEGIIYEYACHEANMAMYDILEVARDEEKAALKKAAGVK